MPQTSPTVSDASMMRPPSPAEAAFHEVRRRAVLALSRSRFEEAFELFEEALDHARAVGEPDLIDRAVCGRAAAALRLETGEDLIPALREILVRNSDDENCFLAAYNVSFAYDRARLYRKALFYARVALGHARRLGREEWVSSSHNQIANQLLATSFFDEACGEYEKALDLLPAGAELEKALIFDNVGYCRIVQGRFSEGFRLLFWSLRTLRRLGARGYQTYPHLGLCFAYLEVGRARASIRHGYRALQIAEAKGDTESTKNALYLLGEAANEAGAQVLARRFFSRLQTEFYPDEGYLPELLLSVNVRSLIHLRA